MTSNTKVRILALCLQIIFSLWFHHLFRRSSKHGLANQTISIKVMTVVIEEFLMTEPYHSCLNHLLLKQILFLRNKPIAS